MYESIIDLTYNFAKKYHSQDNSGHDFEHIKRVYSNACLLLKQTPQCNEFVVKMSALLHDVDDRKLGTDGNNTLKFLQTLDMDEVIIKQILDTINAISFSKSGDNPNFLTVEMKLLSDADKLDAIGAIGICRAIMFGTSRNAKFFDENIFPQTNLTKDEYKDLTRTSNNTINHFFDKLLKLKDAMKTDIGKKEAQKRHEFMILFLEQFFQENNLPEWQKYLNQYLEDKLQAYTKL